VVKSEDAGKTWQDLTQNLPTPQNDAGDAPAPAVADLTYRQLHGNIYAKDQFTFIAEWDSDGAGDYRGWLLKTTDDGVTWTQVQL
jgi:hypothetical protein